MKRHQAGTYRRATTNVFFTSTKTTQTHQTPLFTPGLGSYFECQVGLRAREVCDEDKYLRAAILFRLILRRPFAAWPSIISSSGLQGIFYLPKCGFVLVHPAGGLAHADDNPRTLHQIE